MTPSERHVIVREDGETLVVSQGAHLGGVCVKCGTNEAIHPRFEVLQHAPSWTYALLCFGPLGIIAAAFLQRSGGVTLPICPACDARWRRATAGAAMSR